jgi:queuine tRNA-ribosyltransferase
MYRILDIMKEILPEDKPRYLMGVGTPEDLIEGIYR